MKKLLTVLLTFFMVFALVGCSSSSNDSTDDTTDNSGAAEGVYQVAVVTDIGLLKDGGFNEGTSDGAEAFANANGLTYQYYQPAGDQVDDRIAAFRQAIENGAEVIVCPGYLQADAITTVAAEAPDVKFVWVDGWNIGADNVTAISYREEESGYFAGYAAVKEGYTNLGGIFGGGGANAACNRFAFGYIQGIEAAAAELGTEVNTTISFKYADIFQPSPELEAMVSGWYTNGTEVVFSCGGSILSNVVNAAETNGGKIIGVDTDQANESENVITSAVKALVPSVQLVLTEWLNGEWDEKLADKTSNLGASEDSTGLPTEETSWRFETFTVEEYEALFEKVANGEVSINTDCADLTTEEAWSTLAAACSHVKLNLEY